MKENTDINNDEMTVLSREEHEQLWRLILECNSIESLSDLELTLCHFRRLFPYEMSFCGVANLVTDEINVYLNFGCPAKVFSELLNGTEAIHDPFFSRWRRSHSPYFSKIAQLENEERQKEREPGIRWLETLREFGVTNAAVHGAMGITARAASYFSFFQLPEPFGERENHLLFMLVPHLHAALGNILQSSLLSEDAGVYETCFGSGQAAKSDNNTDDSIRQLTPRELEVLHWAQAGKTNWEIGSILGIAEFTVKNHMRAIMHKLHVSNRTHAVAKAMDANLLHTAAK